MEADETKKKKGKRNRIEFGRGRKVVRDSRESLVERIERVLSLKLSGQSIPGRLPADVGIGRSTWLFRGRILNYPSGLLGSQRLVQFVFIFSFLSPFFFPSFSFSFSSLLLSLALIALTDFSRAGCACVCVFCDDARTASMTMSFKN